MLPHFVKCLNSKCRGTPVEKRGVEGDLNGPSSRQVVTSASIKHSCQIQVFNRNCSRVPNKPEGKLNLKQEAQKLPVVPLDVERNLLAAALLTAPPPPIPSL
jgi:hypothetical protein